MTSIADRPVPVDLVTGFLGSGKTTLINAVLRDPAFAGTLVIVNEFGEVGLDHMLVSSADDQVVLLDSGCLCCAASGTLRDTLIDLFNRRPPGQMAEFNRIIVETSGLAHPAPLVASLLGDSALTPRCRLSQVMTVVDAGLGGGTLERYTESRRQVAFADQIVISKTDAANPVAIASLEMQLSDINAQAPVGFWCKGISPAPLFDAQRVAQLSGKANAALWVRGPLRPQYAAGESDLDIHSDAFGRISSHVLSFADALDWPRYAAITQALSARLGKRLLRCKGLLVLGDDAQIWIVQGVQGYFAPPQRLAARPPDMQQGFLVCIGESISRADLDAILAFDSAPISLTSGSSSP